MSATPVKRYLADESAINPMLLIKSSATAAKEQLLSCGNYSSKSKIRKMESKKIKHCRTITKSGKCRAFHSNSHSWCNEHNRQRIIEHADYHVVNYGKSRFCPNPKYQNLSPPLKAVVEFILRIKYQRKYMITMNEGHLKWLKFIQDKYLNDPNERYVIYGPFDKNFNLNCDNDEKIRVVRNFSPPAPRIQKILSTTDK